MEKGLWKKCSFSSLEKLCGLGWVPLNIGTEGYSGSAQSVWRLGHQKPWKSCIPSISIWLDKESKVLLHSHHQHKACGRPATRSRG